MCLDFGMTIAQGDPQKFKIISGLLQLTWGRMKMLKVENLVVAYGGIEALKGITVEVPDKKIVTLIGANGAGKSTLLRTLSDW
jgi:ABC-type molybdenum transport system ATPase subunit/photorepair protein PhrA